MDFMAQVQSHLMSSQYAKLMEKSKIQNYGKRVMTSSMYLEVCAPGRIPGT